MSTQRTVSWLAILSIILPFLAIPTWLTKTIAVVLGVGIIAAVRYGHGRKQQQPGSRFSNHSEDNADTDDDTPDGATKGAANSAAEAADTDEDQAESEPVDIEDPDADRMIAENLRRRRSKNEPTDEE